jgi:hypothetical protein
MSAPLFCLACRERLALARGLCLACYGRLSKAVRAGQTTWEALAAAGQALPAQQPEKGGHGRTRDTDGGTTP